MIKDLNYLYCQTLSIFNKNILKNNKINNYFIRTYKVSSKSYLTVPNYLDEIIIGSMLGDLSAHKAYINSYTRLTFTQSIKNRIYIEHMYSLFEKYCGSRPLIRTIKNTEYKCITFNTLSLPCFNVYMDLFYKFNGIRYKKVVPKDLAKYLTPIGLAY